MRAARATAALVIVLAGVAGCGSGLNDDLGAETRQPQTVSPAAGLQHCPRPSATGEWPGTRLPTGFVAAEVFDCKVEIRRVPGDGEWKFLQERRATGDVSSYLESLRAKDARRPKNVSCLAMLILDPPVVVVDAGGTALHPRSPRDVCDQPQQRVRDAYEALAFEIVKEIKLAQWTSQLANDTDCGDTWKDMPAIDVDTWERSAPRGEAWFSARVNTVRVCLFQTNNSEPEPPVGKLRSGAVVEGAEGERLARALERTPAPTPCTERHTSFALVMEVPHGVAVYLQLDGCQRIMTDSGWRQGDAALVAMVRRLGRTQ